ncbi:MULTISPECIES: hypothetical protein [unclassified Streptomyces]|uniref:hypothetical protein n=1 Tax=unclassified Streptomyces TaxID=2593676 RepID=UPI0023671B37|nr:MULTISPECIES: hypothetical protein [unclassified Streptomyces]MDF3141484.1 hypothetical protein [Streptomyces sp. T21Q-yed]WDF45035.1 hypothetical protein PBV52_50955 [Streptomyces sp. T12]
MKSVILAGEFEDIGDHLLNVGNGWAEGSLKFGLLAIVVVTIIKKFSMKAGIGALIGLVIANGIYNGRTDISDAVTDEVTNIKGAPAVHAPLVPGPGTTKPTAPAAGGERA